MAINPPSDLVLGAVLAADPAKYRAAAERLQRARAAQQALGEWSTVAAAAPQPADERPLGSQSGAPVFASAVPRTPTPPASAGGPRVAAKTPDVFAQLEAFVLQSFIQTMLPSNSKAQSFFGKGTAGEVWKSMLADKLGAELSRSGQVGLAKRLAAGRNVAAASPLSAAAISATPRTSASLLDALPYLQGIPPPKSSERS